MLTFGTKREREGGDRAPKGVIERKKDQIRGRSPEKILIELGVISLAIGNMKTVSEVNKVLDSGKIPDVLLERAVDNLAIIETYLELVNR